MRSTTVMAGVAVVVLFALASGATSFSLFNDPGLSDRSLYLTPNTTKAPIFHHQLYGPVGNGTSHWHFTQWQSTANLPAQPVFGEYGPCEQTSNTQKSTPPLWYTQAESGHVCLSTSLTNRSSIIEIYQNGSATSCEEFDSFLGANTDVYSAYPQGMNNSPTLTNMSAVTVTFGAKMISSTVTQGCGHSTPNCGGSGSIDYGYAVLGVVLHNSVAEQTLFYQVTFGDTRDNMGCPHYPGTCVVQPQQWYSDSNPYGANDVIANFDQPCVSMSPKSTGVANERVPYVIHVLPKLVQAVKSGPSTLDADPANWFISGSYLGIGREGHVEQTVVFDTFDIAVTTQP